ncbi:hypothetical protein [Acidicapsa ligni]|uniref:hypothetical protein n=1 Tax=Acidicapsa ligni TaxID=542300 RepID=UPI0021E00E12|nr:hypothetical protein [Acidicapsa ligni]
MVVDLKKLSDSLRQSSPENDLRNDLRRIIRARKSDIEHALSTTGTYVLRVPDGRRIRLSRAVKAIETAEAIGASL